MLDVKLAVAAQLGAARKILRNSACAASERGAKRTSLINDVENSSCPFLIFTLDPQRSQKPTAECQIISFEKKYSKVTWNVVFNPFLKILYFLSPVTIPRYMK